MASSAPTSVAAVGRVLPKVLLVCGPTSVGKTSVSAIVAEKLDAEIVSGDSVQCYKDCNIGTAKPSVALRARIPHYMVDSLPFDAPPIGASLFSATARALVKQIHSRGKVPILVGGSSFYMDSFINPLPCAPSDLAFRAELQRQIKAEGTLPSFEKLKQLDPVYAGKINPKDAHRIVRALEIHHLTGETISSRSWQRNPSSATLEQDEFLQQFDVRPVFLSAPRHQLYFAADLKVEQMINEGLVEETALLVSRGLRPESGIASAVGYKQSIEYINSEWMDTRKTHSLERRMSKFLGHICDVRSATRNLIRMQVHWRRNGIPYLWLNRLESDQDTADQVLRALELDRAAFQRKLETSQSLIETAKAPTKPYHESFVYFNNLHHCFQRIQSIASAMKQLFAVDSGLPHELPATSRVVHQGKLLTSDKSSESLAQDRASSALPAKGGSRMAVSAPAGTA